jgi:hypothetical protein
MGAAAASLTAAVVGPTRRLHARNFGIAKSASERSFPCLVLTSNQSRRLPSYATAVGFGWLPPLTKDIAAGRRWLAVYGNLFRVKGPIVLIGLILAYDASQKLRVTL